MLLIELERIENILAKRRKIASYYNEKFEAVVQCPVYSERYRDAFYTYTIKTDSRDELQSFLMENGVENKIYHPILMPNHSVYKGKFHSPIPSAERALQQILSVPCHENMTDIEVEYVAEKVLQFF